MTVIALRDRPPAWELLERAIIDRKAVMVRYHRHERIISPHLLGWGNNRAKLLAYQTSGMTSTGLLPSNPRQHWRTMFVDEIEHAAMTNDPWRTADNYTPQVPGIDLIETALPSA
jgi:hypothetical protein